jgi:hypothetical protein
MWTLPCNKQTKQLGIVAAIRTLKNKFPFRWMNLEKAKQAEK